MSYSQEAVAPAQADITIIEPSGNKYSLGLKELFDYRELLYFFVWRDIKVRYKQTVLGASWAILQPLATMFIFTLFFGKLAKMPSDGIPYPIFSFAALVPWTFFSNGLAKASNSLVGGSNLLKKVYFPRLCMPVSAVLSGGVDFVLAFLVLLLMMFYFDITPTINVVWLPFLLVLAFVTALGVGLWLSSLNVKFRDVRYIIPFFVQALLFATPVVYPTSLIESDMWRIVYALNPMVGVVEGFRWGLLGTDTAPGPLILVSSIMSVSLFFGGLIYFRKTEKTFADVV